MLRNLLMEGRRVGGSGIAQFVDVMPADFEGIAERTGGTSAGCGAGGAGLHEGHVADRALALSPRAEPLVLNEPMNVEGAPAGIADGKPVSR
jgi:hypothetical protein